MQVQVQDQIAQRCSHVRRVLNQKPDQAKRRGSPLLPNQQAEMGTARTGRAPLQQPTHGSEWNRILRIVEQAQIEIDAGHDFRRISAQFPQYLGNCDEGTDPQRTFAHGNLL